LKTIEKHFARMLSNHKVKEKPKELVTV